MPLIYRILPNSPIPVLVNDLYSLLQTQDFDGIRALVTHDQKYLTEPLGYINGVPLLIMNELLKINNADLISLIIELGLTTVDDLEADAVQFLLNYDQAEEGNELSAEVLAVLLKKHLLAQGKKGPLAFITELYRIQQSDRLDFFTLLVFEPDFRKLLFSDYRIFKCVCILCDRDPDLSSAVILHLIEIAHRKICVIGDSNEILDPAIQLVMPDTEITERSWFEQLAAENISLVRLAVLSRQAGLLDILFSLGIHAHDTKRVTTTIPPLFIAIGDQHLMIEMVEKLLADGASTTQLYYHQDKQLYSPLAYAVLMNNLDAIRIIRATKISRNEPLELLPATRIHQPPAFYSLLPFEVAVQQNDDNLAELFWPVSFSEHLFNIGTPAKLLGAFLTHDTIEAKNLAHLSLAFIQRRMLRAFDRLLQHPKITGEFLSRFIAFYFNDCVALDDLSSWMCLCDKFGRDFPFERHLSIGAYQHLLDLMALETNAEKRANKAAIVNMLWQHYRELVHYNWRGLTRDYMLYEKASLRLLHANATTDKDKIKKSIGFKQLLHTATINGEWYIVSDILSHTCVSNDNNNDDLIDRFAITLASTLRHLQPHTKMVDDFMELVDKDLRFKSVLLTLVYALQFYAAPEAYQIYIDGSAYKIDALLSVDSPLSSKNDIIEHFIEEEAENRAERREPHHNYLELAVATLAPNFRFTHHSNDMAIHLLSWLDENVLNKGDEQELERIRAYCLVGFLRCAMVQLVGLGELEALQDLMDFAFDKNWLLDDDYDDNDNLIQKNEFDTDLAPDLLCLAFHQGNTAIFDWLLARIGLGSRLNITYIINRPSVHVTPEFTFNGKKVSFWQLCGMLLGSSLEHPATDLYSEKTIKQLVMGLTLATSGKLSRDDQRMAEKGLLTLMENNCAIGYCCANFGDHKFFYSLFQRLKNPTDWLNQYVTNSLKMKSTIFLAKLLLALSKNGDTNSIRRLIDRGIRKEEVSLIVECCSILKDRINEETKEHTPVTDCLQAESPLVTVILKLMRMPELAEDSTLSFCYIILRDFLKLDLSHQNSINALATAFYKPSPLHQLEMIEKLVGQPLHDFLSRHLSEKEITLIAMQNEYTAYFMNNPNTLDLIENKTLFNLLLKVKKVAFLEVILIMLSDKQVYELFRVACEKDANKSLEDIARCLGSRINHILPAHLSLLHIACIRQHKNLFALALSTQTEIHTPLRLGDNDWCIDDRVFRLLSTLPILKSDKKWYEGLTAFEICVLTLQTEFVSKLATLHPNPHRFISLTAIDNRLKGRTLLSIACEMNCLPLVQTLFSIGIDPELADYLRTNSTQIQTVLRQKMSGFSPRSQLPFAYLSEQTLPSYVDYEMQLALVAKAKELLIEPDAVGRSQTLLTATENNIRILITSCRKHITQLQQVEKKHSLSKKDALFKDFVSHERQFNKPKPNVIQNTVIPALRMINELGTALQLLIDELSQDAEILQHISRFQRLNLILYRAFEHVMTLRLTTSAVTEQLQTALSQEASLTILQKRFEKACLSLPAVTTSEPAQPTAGPAERKSAKQPKQSRKDKWRANSDSGMSISSTSSASASSDDLSSSMPASLSTSPTSSSMLSSSGRTDASASPPSEQEGSESLLNSNTPTLMSQNSVTSSDIISPIPGSPGEENDDSMDPQLMNRVVKMVFAGTRDEDQPLGTRKPSQNVYAIFVPGYGMYYELRRNWNITGIRFFAESGKPDPFAPITQEALKESRWPVKPAK